MEALRALGRLVGASPAGQAGFAVGAPLVLAACGALLRRLGMPHADALLLLAAVVAVAGVAGREAGWLATAASAVLLLASTAAAGSGWAAAVLAAAGLGAVGLLLVALVAGLRAQRAQAERDRGLLDALMTNAPFGVGFIDARLRFVRVNEAVARVHGTAAAAHAGRTYPEVAPRLAPRLQAGLERVLREVLATGAPAVGVELTGPDASAAGQGRHWVGSFYRVSGGTGAADGVGFVTVDITERTRAEAALRRRNALLAAILDVLGQVVADAEPGIVYDRTLQHLLALTESTFGFVGEVHHDERGERFLRMQAITNLAWDDATRTLFAEQGGRGLEFRNLDTLFGAVVRSGEYLISNDPANDSRAGGLPPGHPSLQAFLGLPLRRGERLLGVVGLANRPAGYDQTLVADLQPFLAACTQVLEAHESEQRRRVAEEDRESLLRTEQRMRGEAESAARARDAVVAALSHELRTPIGPIVGWAQLLRDPGLSEDERQLAVDVIERNGRTLVRLVDDLLDVSPVLEAQLALDLQDVSLSEVIADAVEPLRVALEAKALVLDVHVPADVDDVRADRGRLGQIVANLVSNAVKASPPGGRIDVSAERLESGLALSVRDTGHGFAPETLAGVFDRVVRGPANGNRGLGLGLVVSRRLAEAHGGTIRAESGGPGHGAAFVVTLPLPRVGGRRTAQAGRRSTA